MSINLKKANNTSIIKFYFYFSHNFKSRQIVSLKYELWFNSYVVPHHLMLPKFLEIKEIFLEKLVFSFIQFLLPVQLL
jgi:hypothetical protein